MTIIRWSGNSDYFEATTARGGVYRVRRTSRREALDGDVILAEVAKAVAGQATTREVIEDVPEQRP